MGAAPSSADVTSIDGPAPGAGVPRLPFIDGVRGLAAVVVLVGHMLFIVPTMAKPALGDAGPADLAVWPFRFGGEMVYLFLLVSGFSLYYSEAGRRRRGKPATTIRHFAARRAWRIGPVYYVALGLGLLTVPLMERLVLRPENHDAAGMSPGSLVAHLFLVHDVRAEWAEQINAPLWSISAEVQLYLLFPALFWLMRRWNPWLVAVAAVAASHVGGTLLPAMPVWELARWFIAGCLLAELAGRGWRVPLVVSLPAGVVALVAAMSGEFDPGLGSNRHDALWLAAFLLLLFACLASPAGRWNPMAARPVRWLGARSYSLYAMHWPVFVVLLYLAQRAGLTGWSAAGFTVGLGLPAAVGLAMLAYRYVEAPSQRRVDAVGRQMPSRLSQM